MDEIRREHLLDNWNNETNEAWTQEWRDGLTPEELEYIAQLDGGYDKGVCSIAMAILTREKVREKYGPAEIRELKAVGDHCMLWLRDGRLFLARLGRDRELLLDEIDGVC